MSLKYVLTTKAVLGVPASVATATMRQMARPTRSRTYGAYWTNFAGLLESDEPLGPAATAVCIHMSHTHVEFAEQLKSFCA